MKTQSYTTYVPFSVEYSVVDCSLYIPLDGLWLRIFGMTVENHSHERYKMYPTRSDCKGFCSTLRGIYLSPHVDSPTVRSSIFHMSMSVLIGLYEKGTIALQDCLTSNILAGARSIQLASLYVEFSVIH